MDSKEKFIVEGNKWLLIFLILIVSLENLLFMLIASLSFLFGLFIYLNSSATIDLQKKFYSLINWKMEPISLPKEIRNTKVMGVSLMIFVILCCFYVWIY